jgi:hypothetical protein
MVALPPSRGRLLCRHVALHSGGSTSQLRRAPMSPYDPMPMVAQLRRAPMTQCDSMPMVALPPR